MVTWEEAVQPDKSPTTVYVVAETGVAVTLEPVDELSVDDGLHVYKLPAALSCID